MPSLLKKRSRRDACIRAISFRFCWTEGLDDEGKLRARLTKQGVTGYAQSLLVMDRFGYPDFLLATADELVDDQYTDRPLLRPIYDVTIEAAAMLG